MSNWSLVLLVCLTGWVSYATIRLEYLNSVADYRLPMDDVKAQSKAHDGSGAWRASRMDEATWKRFYITRHGNETDRSLTPEEEIEMRRHIRQANANADLRDFAGTMGCFQYPAILIAIILSIQLLAEKRKPPTWRSSGVAFLLINLACLAMTVYRGPVRALID